MASSNRRGGLIHLSYNGKTLLAKGAFEVNLGVSKKTPVYSSSASGAVGFKYEPQSGKISGEILIDEHTDVNEIANLEKVSVVLELTDGSVYALKNGFFSEEGTISSDEGSMKFCVEGPPVEVIKTTK